MPDSLFDIFDSPVQKQAVPRKQRNVSKSKKSVKTDNQKNDQSVGWLSYTHESKPPVLVPCQFRVKTDTGYSKTFYAYIEYGGYLCTNDTQLLILRKKYSITEYKPISNCDSVLTCNHGYLNCAKCTKNK